VFADILDAYGQTNKNFWRGLYAISRTFLNLRARRLRLTIDGVRVSERAVMCTVANAYRMGAGAPLAPGASVVDGLLDVVILGDLSRLELLAYYRAIRANRHLGLPKVQAMTAKSVRIEAALPLPVHVDDRVIGTAPVDIEIRPHCLRVVVKKA
jgi:diacylglycerol kinase (ATP)